LEARFGPQKDGTPSLSEAVLAYGPGELRHMRLPAPVCVNEEGDFEPFFVVVDSPGYPGLLETSIDFSREGTDGFPAPVPDGLPSWWDSEMRIWRTRYGIKLAQGDVLQPVLSQSNRLKFRDVLDVIHHVGRGIVFPFIDSLVPFRVFTDTSDGSEAEIMKIPSDDDPRRSWTLSFMFRGAAYPYEYPLRPSLFRPFLKDGRISDAYLALLRLTLNLVVEFCWLEFGWLPMPWHATTIVQQYKLLPYTGMIDMTKDPRVALWFALQRDASAPDYDPTLYLITVMEPNSYTRGAHYMWNMDTPPYMREASRSIPRFLRHKAQRAISFAGLGPHMTDPTGLLVSLAEHRLGNPPSLRGLKDLWGDNDLCAETLAMSTLFPTEPDGVKRMLGAVMAGIRRFLDVGTLEPTLALACRLAVEQLEASMRHGARARP
jgi:FRG domain-containing protein